MSHGTCAYCARTKRLDRHGLVVVHYLTIPVSAKASWCPWPPPTVPAGQAASRDNAATARPTPAGLVDLECVRLLVVAGFVSPANPDAHDRIVGQPDGDG